MTMDEPMDDSSMPAEEDQTNHVDAIQKKNDADGKIKLSSASILGPGSMVMMTITVEDYENQYWPRLQNAITQLLTMTPGEYIPISYEQMYSCVYKCVCKQFSERLYGDLLLLITSHLEQLCSELQAKMKSDPVKYLEVFDFSLKQYLQALGGIVPIFNYMNRFYVETKLKTDLNLELRNLFVQYVADTHIHTLIPLLVDASSKPFVVSPPTMARLITNLYDLKAEYATLRPQLFARYLPNILPPCRQEDMHKYIEEVQQMQRDLRAHPDFISGDQRNKRPGEGDPPKSGPLSFLPKTNT